MKTSAHQTGGEDEAIEATAAAWLVEKEEGFSPSRAAQFTRWREADARHATAVALLETTCGILGQLPLLRADSELRQELEDLKRSPPNAAAAKFFRFPFRPWVKISIAAAAALALLFAVGSLRQTRPTFSHHFVTAPGGYQRVVLPDESVLELNAATEVQVRYSTSARDVTLTRGEAHFTVAKNPELPFRVDAGAIAVRAVGTAFNVRLEPLAVEVIVTEGRVQLSRAAGSPARPAGSSAGNTDRLVVAGQRVTVAMEDGSGKGAPVAAVDAGVMSAALTWRSPRLVFLDTPLSEVARQFNRHNRVQLEIGDRELGERAVGGTFLADNVESFVRLLRDSRDIAVERPDADRIVLRRVAPAP